MTPKAMARPGKACGRATAMGWWANSDAYATQAGILERGDPSKWGAQTLRSQLGRRARVAIKKGKFKLERFYSPTKA